MKQEQERQKNERDADQGQGTETGPTQEEAGKEAEEIALLVDKLSLAEESILEFKTNATGMVSNHFGPIFVFGPFKRFSTKKILAEKPISTFCH